MYGYSVEMCSMRSGFLGEFVAIPFERRKRRCRENGLLEKVVEVPSPIGIVLTFPFLRSRLLGHSSIDTARLFLS